MKSIDKLREAATYNPAFSDNATRIVCNYLSEIEAEIAANYLELPVDADGVPICVGDVVAAQDEQPFEVRAFQLDALGWFAIERLGSQWNVNQLHHVKPRTLEDVLKDAGVSRAAISDVADEIRDLLGGDVE